MDKKQEEIARSRQDYVVNRRVEVCRIFRKSTLQKMLSKRVKAFFFSFTYQLQFIFCLKTSLTHMINRLDKSLEGICVKNIIMNDPSLHIFS